MDSDPRDFFIVLFPANLGMPQWRQRFFVFRACGFPPRSGSVVVGFRAYGFPPRSSSKVVGVHNVGGRPKDVISMCFVAGEKSTWGIQGEVRIRWAEGIG